MLSWHCKNDSAKESDKLICDYITYSYFFLIYQTICGEPGPLKQKEKWFIGPCLIISPAESPPPCRPNKSVPASVETKKYIPFNGQVNQTAERQLFPRWDVSTLLPLPLLLCHICVSVCSLLLFALSPPSLLIPSTPFQTIQVPAYVRRQGLEPKRCNKTTRPSCLILF